jgi:hypothetical protein
MRPHRRGFAATLRISHAQPTRNPRRAFDNVGAGLQPGAPHFFRWENSKEIEKNRDGVSEPAFRAEKT